MSYVSSAPLDEEIDPLENTDDELESAAMHVIGEDEKEGELSDDDDLEDIVVIKLGADEKADEVEEEPKSALEELEELERKLHSGELDGDDEDKEDTDKIESFDDEEE